MEAELYFPSNGSEGIQFMDTYCQHCIRDTTLRGGNKSCDILDKSMFKEKLKQWIYKDGIPTCTSFVKVGSVKKKQPEIPNQAKISLF